MFVIIDSHTLQSRAIDFVTIPTQSITLNVSYLNLCQQSLVEQCPNDDPDTEVNLGCLLFKEGRYEQATQKFTTAMQVLGYRPGNGCTIFS